MTPPPDNEPSGICRVAVLPIGGPAPDHWADCLDHAEHARLRRFLRARDRDTFVAAHALLRALLSELDGRPPGAWRFAVDGHGKPHIDTCCGPALPSFSISHTHGMVAAAVDPGGRALGIDVEALDRAIAPAVAERALDGQERALVEALEPEPARAALLQRWVLKEALTKAAGRGIALSFTRIGFAETDPPRPRFTPCDELGHPGDWHIEHWCTGDTHRLALAIHRGHTPRIAVRVRTLDRAGLDALLSNPAG